MIIPKYYEDLKVLHQNTMPNRAYYIPASKKLENLVERESSDRFLRLSGQWKFRYFDSVYDVKDEFYKEEYDTRHFDTVTVPGVWQNYGYDRHQYTNTRYPFPIDPPHVPYENPCGEYICRFSYHKDEKAPKAFLNFEGVDSCFYVWLNGEYVGYSQVSHSTSEFDVTAYMKEGENTLAVLVLKWCDGSYMEDQDKFRMNGIFRDVYILKRPMEGIFDYFIKAVPSDDYKNGKIEISFRYQNEQVPVRLKLLDQTENLVWEGAAQGDNTAFTVENAHLWNAEEPYLYTLLIETENEIITDYIGIREIHAKDGILYINGAKVKFHGTNRHDSDPVTGFAISTEQIMKDLQVMKEHNINAIRTSHYPNAPHFYLLYDLLGFYIVDEADDESHGTADAYHPDATWESRCKHWNEMIADNPVYTEATLDRTKRCVERDKNRPSVVIWSMGNECAYGCTFEESLRWTKTFDATRLTHYEAARYVSGNRKYDYSNLDTYSRMYPSIEEIHDYFKEDGTKPFIMCEYCHAMGNGPGDLEDYFQVVQSYDGACGGFIWEWCDHAVETGKTITGKKMYAYGGDHEEYPHDGNFCMDGLVYPDRTPHTGLLEFKNVHRPARVVAYHQKTGALELRNYMDFVNLKDYLVLHYEVLCDGMKIEEGSITDASLLDILPHDTKSVPLPINIPEAGKCFLKVSYYLKEKTQILPAGFLLGFEEVAVETAQKKNRKVEELFLTSGEYSECKTQIKQEEDDRFLVLSTQEFSYIYDKFTGLFSEMTYKNRSILKRPMELNIWRAPTDNDRNIKFEWIRAQYDRGVTRAYETRSYEEDGKVKIKTELSLSALTIQRILTITAKWSIYPDGTVDVCMDVKKNKEFPFLPRFGLRLFLPRSMQEVTYCGIGPAESYIDKKWAGYHGLFRTDIRSMHEDYIRPQENGSHYDCDYVILSDNRGSFTVAGEETFSFNASVYTQEELTKKRHNYELMESPYTVLCIDYRQSGIGSNSCGPQLLEKYRLNEETFTFTVRLKVE